MWNIMNGIVSKIQPTKKNKNHPNEHVEANYKDLNGIVLNFRSVPSQVFRSDPRDQRPSVASKSACKTAVASSVFHDAGVGIWTSEVQTTLGSTWIQGIQGSGHQTWLKSSWIQWACTFSWNMSMATPRPICSIGFRTLRPYFLGSSAICFHICCRQSHKATLFWVDSDVWGNQWNVLLKYVFFVKPIVFFG